MHPLAQVAEPAIPATSIGLALMCLTLLGLLIRWVIVAAQASSNRADKAVADHVAGLEAERDRALAEAKRAWSAVEVVEAEAKRERAEWDQERRRHAQERAILEARLRERDG